MRCIYRLGMYAAHTLYIRPPYAAESRWSSCMRRMYAVHTPFARWIRNGQVLIRDIIRSGIAIHAPYAPHVRHSCANDAQLIRNTCERVAPEMFHQTISAILLCIWSFFRTPYERSGIAGQWNRGILCYRESQISKELTTCMKLAFKTTACSRNSGSLSMRKYHKFLIYRR